MSTIGSSAVRARQKKSDGGDHGDHREADDGLVVEPVVAGALFEHILEAAEGGGERDQADPVDPAQQRQVRLVEIDQEEDGDGHQRCRGRH